MRIISVAIIDGPSVLLYYWEGNSENYTILMSYILQQENELVVQAALRKNSSFKLVGFMPQWKQRGLPIFEEGRETQTRCIT